MREPDGVCVTMLFREIATPNGFDMIVPAGGVAKPILTVSGWMATMASLMKHGPLLRLLLARGFAEFAYTMSGVALGWQVYEKTHSALALGLMGLVQFVPSVVFVFVAGHVADRLERKRIAAACQFASAILSLFLAFGCLGGWLNVSEIFAAILLLGVAGAFEDPALAALTPAVAPAGMVARSSALFYGASTFASIAGPAVGGLLYAWSPAVPYAVMAGFWAVSAACILTMAIGAFVPPGDPPALGQLFAGLSFVRNEPAIFGTISLDLFAVLLGGATTVLPIFARDVLHTGVLGLGVLRAAPSVGALVMTIILARRSMTRLVGIRMFGAVIVFGLATVGFALSHFLWLSIVMLIVMGASDTVSVVIRRALVQLRTPDAMRGRVGAVNALFINASNQLGGFESGITAALWGVVPATLFGGFGTIVVALLWMYIFPTLRNVQRLESEVV